MIAIAILFNGLESKRRNRVLVTAGLLLGLGYLVRIGSLVLVPIILITIWLKK